MCKKLSFRKNKVRETMPSKSKSAVKNNNIIIQKQEAGENSQQFQAETMVIQQGIDEKRVREICAEVYEKIRKELTEDAFAVADQRISEFEKVLMPKVLAVEGAMEAFAAPGFQKLLSKAHSSAVATSNIDDYELLTEFLMHRVQTKEDRIKYTGISKAIEIIDYIDTAALLGMTVAHAVKRLIPMSNNVKAGLKIMDDLFGKLIDGDLPNGREWLDHLDILDCVRVNSISKLRKFEEYYALKMDGFVCTGIKEGSVDYENVLEILKNNDIPIDFFQENPLLEGYYIIGALSKNDIDQCRDVQNCGNIRFSDKQKKCISQIYEMYDKNISLTEAVKQNFLKEIDALENLKVVKDWWNSIPMAFDITAAGGMIAHANAMRKDSDIPSLD